jgi:hypothetical protein
LTALPAAFGYGQNYLRIIFSDRVCETIQGVLMNNHSFSPTEFPVPNFGALWPCHFGARPAQGPPQIGSNGSH